eukprot:878350-Pyramimonas_sp.AAC.1
MRNPRAATRGFARQPQTCKGGSAAIASKEPRGERRNGALQVSSLSRQSDCDWARLHLQSQVRSICGSWTGGGTGRECRGRL